MDAKPDFWSARVIPSLLPRDESRNAATEFLWGRTSIRAMNPLANDWPIKHRADACAQTERPFEAGEQFYTLLFQEGQGFRREDLSEEAWAQRNENIKPFSFWKTRYEPAPTTPPEPLEKEEAEDILRRLLTTNDPAQVNACYVLAIMLERKRVLKQIRVDETGG